MGGFALPALPSLPSFHSLLNASPPLIYNSTNTTTSHPPHPAQSTHSPYHPSRYRSRSTTALPGDASGSGSGHVAANGVDGGRGWGGAEGECLASGSGPSTPTRPPRSASTLLPASSPSANEGLSNLAEWEPIRRISSSASTEHGFGGVVDRPDRPPPPLFDGSPSSSHPTSPRPSRHGRGHAGQHRRAQSAVPRPRLTPLGRLHDISRNPLASTSAVSLPTLAEMDHGADFGDDRDGEGEDDDSVSDLGHGSVPPSPLVRPRQRRVSKNSLIQPPSPMSLHSALPGDPDDTEGFTRLESATCDTGADAGRSRYSVDEMPPPRRGRLLGRSHSQKYASNHQQSISSIPPPNPSHSSQTMPPPPLPRPPPLSPRSQSVQDISHARRAQPLPFALSRRSSVTSVTSVTSGVTTSSVSDVAVLARWTFPNTPSPPKLREASDRGRPDGESHEAKQEQEHGQDDLRARLRRLSMGEGGRGNPSASVPTLSQKPLFWSTASSFVRPELGRTSSAETATASRGGRPGHRYTHSSPVSFPPPPPISISGPTHLLQSGYKANHGQVYSHHDGRVIPLPPPPPPRPLNSRRPTTSRLRNPNPLCMPTRPSSASIASMASVASAASAASGVSGTSGSVETGRKAERRTTTIPINPNSSVGSGGVEGEGCLSSSPGSMTSCSASDDTHGPCSVEADMGMVPELGVGGTSTVSLSDSIISLSASSPSLPLDGSEVPEYHQGAKPAKTTERVWWIGRMKRRSFDAFQSARVDETTPTQKDDAVSMLSLKMRDPAQTARKGNDHSFKADDEYTFGVRTRRRASSEAQFTRLEREREPESDEEQYLTLDDI